MRSYVIGWLSHFMPNGVAVSIAPSWFSCVGLAGLFGLLLMLRAARTRGVDQGVIASVVLWCYLAAVAAGIIVPMTIDAFEQLFTTGHVMVRWSGMTSFWGYLAGGIAVAIVCRQNKLPLARLGDMAAIPMGVALLFARIGCFLGGCDYGKVTNVPWAVRFPAGSAAWRDHLQSGLLPPERAESLAVHPTQLYEALLGLVIVGVAVWAARQKWREGRVFLAAAATYAVGRIVVEIFRGDLGRGIYAGLSSGQLFSICVLLAITIAGFLDRRRVLAVITISFVAVALGASRPATAQPAPPASAPPAPPGLAQPTDPYAPPPPPAAAGPEQPPASAPRTTTKPPLRLELGVLGAFAMPVDRRADQVSSLGGLSLSAGILRNQRGAWLDLDSLGNRDASHGTILLSGGVLARLHGSKLSLGGRAGIGATLVNFDEPAFRDAGGAALRFEALAEYALSDRWLVHLRPLSIDILSAADLGGPVTTWQIRAGVAYQLDLRSSR